MHNCQFQQRLCTYALFILVPLSSHSLILHSIPLLPYLQNFVSIFFLFSFSLSFYLPPPLFPFPAEGFIPISYLVRIVILTYTLFLTPQKQIDIYRCVFNIFHSRMWSQSPFTYKCFKYILSG